MATLYAKTAGGDWSAAGTWSNSSAAGGDSSGPPTAADDVIFELLSGNVTIDTGAVCRSLDCTSGTGGYTGVLTHNASTLSIGDGTAGAGNVALKFVAGMTYTKLSATSSAISFVSTSVTQQTITSAGKVLGNTTFNATSGGSWIFSDAFSANSSTSVTLTLTKGSLDTNGQDVSIGSFSSSSSNVRSLLLQSSSISVDGDWIISSTNLTFDSGTSHITLGFFSALQGAGLTYYDVTWSDTASPGNFNTPGTFHNLTLISSTSKTVSWSVNATLTVTNLLTLTGNSKTNRLLVRNSTIGDTTTISAGSVDINAVDFRDIEATGAASWDLSASSDYTGDCGGNSGITFTTPETQTATGTASFTWSTHGWTSRVPLPQDDVVVNNSFVAGRTVTIDMPRAGKSIDFSGCGGSPAVTFNTSLSIFGSLNLTNIGTLTHSNITTFEGRSDYLLTSAGKSIPGAMTLDAPGGKLTLQDDIEFTVNGLTVNRGHFDANDFNITTTRLTSSNSNIRTISMGIGIWTLTGTGTIWNLSAVTNLTLNEETSTIKFTNSTSTDRTFAGGGQTYNNFWSAAGASTANLTITGSNTFNDFKDDGSAAHTIKFTTGTTQTVTTFTVSGSSGNLITIDSTSTGTHALTKSGGGEISCDYLNIQHSVARPWSGAAGIDTWYAGLNSTDNQSTTTAGSGWIFDSPDESSSSSSISSTSSSSSSSGDTSSSSSSSISSTSSSLSSSVSSQSSTSSSSSSSLSSTSSSSSSSLSSTSSSSISSTSSSTSSSLSSTSSSSFSSQSSTSSSSPSSLSSSSSSSVSSTSSSSSSSTSSSTSSSVSSLSSTSSSSSSSSQSSSLSSSTSSSSSVSSTSSSSSLSSTSSPSSSSSSTSSSSNESSSSISTSSLSSSSSFSSSSTSSSSSVNVDHHPRGVRILSARNSDVCPTPRPLEDEIDDGLLHPRSSRVSPPC